jgi:hypothetical protein
MQMAGEFMSGNIEEDLAVEDQLNDEVLMLLATPGMTAATATKPAINA